MSKTDAEDTPPAGEIDTAETGATSLSDIFADRHQPQSVHEPHREVGAAPQEEPAPAAAPESAQPAPKAATTPAAPAGDPDPATDPKAPKWYREHMRKVNGELAALRASTAAPQAPAPQPRPAAPAATLPNPAEDPQGYHDAVQRGLSSQFQRFQLETTLNFSERFLRQQHGAEAFEETKAWLSTKPDIEAWAIQQPDPWAAAYTQYTREKIADEIGDDPAAYRKRIEEEIRAEYEARSQARQDQHIPASAPQMRSAPPAPASTARSAAPRDPQTGQFTGPAPLKTRNKF